MTRETVLRVLESALLIIALGFTLVPIPSNEDSIDLFPALALAALCFAFSRYLRWRDRWALWAVELAAFTAYAWGCKQNRQHLDH